MQLDLQKSGGNFIRSFSAGEIHVNEQVFFSNIIVTAEQIITDWSPPEIENLSIMDFRPALELDPELILFGTGLVQRFPGSTMMSEIMRKGVGLEVMDTAAACRTFNVLTGEHRQVVAALLIG